MSKESVPEEEPSIGRSHPDFNPVYTHTSRDDGIEYTSPFPVVVFGIHEEFFGVGNVIGNVRDNPIIEVQDCDTGETHYVMGYESWWTCPPPEEILDKMATGELTTDSVAAYRTATDDYWRTVEMGDDEFLNEAGIDPES